MRVLGGQEVVRGDTVKQITTRGLAVYPKPLRVQSIVEGQGLVLGEELDGPPVSNGGQAQVFPPGQLMKL